jgi:predicted ribosomally synthesized peptide with nif11-like leader
MIMSVESAKAFLAKFNSDSDFRAKLEGAGDAAATQAIVKEAGFEFSKAELKECAAASSELSDADLENVAGGNAAEWSGAAVGTVAAVVAGAGL